MTSTAWCPAHHRREPIDDEYDTNDAWGRTLYVAVLDCGTTLTTEAA